LIRIKRERERKRKANGEWEGLLHHRKKNCWEKGWELWAENGKRAQKPKKIAKNTAGKPGGVPGPGEGRLPKKGPVGNLHQPKNRGG